MKRRLAKGAKVAVKPLDARGVEDVRELLSAYIRVLREAKREEKAKRLESSWRTRRSTSAWWNP